MANCIKCGDSFESEETDHGRMTVRCPRCRDKRAERQRLLRAGEVEKWSGGFAPLIPSCPICGSLEVGNCICCHNMTDEELELSYKRIFNYGISA